MRCWFDVSFFVKAGVCRQKSPCFFFRQQPSLFKPEVPSASQLIKTSYSGKLQFHGPGMSKFAFVEFSGCSKYRAENVGVAVAAMMRVVGWGWGFSC
jgi:hypothetical protein